MHLRIQPTYAIALALLSAATSGFAQNQRSFVSTAGNDANACTVAAPCRSFGTAADMTLEGGEIVVLESGGYGPFAVSKTLSVIAPPGVHAALTAFSGTGITVDAAADDRVILRGLSLTGIGGVNGIDLQNGRLFLDRTSIDGFGETGVLINRTGVTDYVELIAVRLTVTDSGVAGIHAHSTSVGAFLAISDSLIVGNPNGIRFGDGVMADLRNVSVWRSALNGLEIDTASFSRAFVSGCDFSLGGSGVKIGGTGSPILSITRSTIANNSFGGLSQLGSSTVETFGDNAIVGNTIFNTSGTLTPVSTQ